MGGGAYSTNNRVNAAVAAKANARQPVEEVVSLNSPFDEQPDAFASTVAPSNFTISPKLTESTMYGTQHRFQPKTPELLEAESLLANLDVDALNKYMGGFEMKPLGSGITPELLETIVPTLQDKSLTELGLTREEIDPNVFESTESFLEFEKKATEEQQEMQLGNLQSLAAEDPTQFGNTWTTLQDQDQLRYIDKLDVSKDDRLNLMAQSLTTHANNLNRETGEPIRQYVVAKGKVWDIGGWGNKTFFWRTADVPGQKAGQSFDSGGVLEFALNNPLTQIAGMVNPVVALATTATKAATGMKVSPMEIASGLLTGLEMAGVVKPPATFDNGEYSDALGGVDPFSADLGTAVADTGIGLFGSSYAQTQTALNVAAAGDAKGAAIALVGNGLIKDGLDIIGLDQAAIEGAGIQYDDFQAGIGKTVKKLAEGEELDEALAHGLGKYIREGGTLGSIDLPSVDLGIDLGGIEKLAEDLVRPIGAIATDLAHFVEDGAQAIGEATRPIIKAIEEPLKPVGDVIEDVAQASGDVIEDVGQAVGDVVEDVAKPVGDVIEDVAQGAGDVLSDLDTAVRQALPNTSIDLPSVDLPSVDLPNLDLPNLGLNPSLGSTGMLELKYPSATRTTDALFGDELFKFKNKIEPTKERLEYIDLNEPVENFFEDTINERLPRSYMF